MTTLMLAASMFYAGYLLGRLLEANKWEREIEHRFRSDHE